MLCCGYTAYGNVHIRLVFIRICALDFPGYRDYPFRLGDLHNVSSCVFLPGWLVRKFTSLSLYMFFWFLTMLFFIYLSSYGPFASSALAGQSLASKYFFSPLFPKVWNLFLIHRLLAWSGNLSGTAFPLFTTQMFKALGYKWANTVFGCVAVIMAPIPFVQFFSLEPFHCSFESVHIGPFRLWTSYSKTK